LKILPFLESIVQRVTTNYCFVPGFVQILESLEIKMLTFPGLKSPGKGIGSGKPWKSLGILK